MVTDVKSSLSCHNMITIYLSLKCHTCVEVTKIKFASWYIRTSHCLNSLKIFLFIATSADKLINVQIVNNAVMKWRNKIASNQRD